MHAKIGSREIFISFYFISFYFMSFYYEVTNVYEVYGTVNQGINFERILWYWTQKDRTNKIIMTFSQNYN